MKFRKVKIVRGREVVEYNQNLVDFKKHFIRATWDDQEYDWRADNKRRKTLKKPGKRLKLENTSWFVIDAESGEKITRCDSIEQAKRFCIKNSYDFGMF
jgi:hypothetical protein